MFIFLQASADLKSAFKIIKCMIDNDIWLANSSRRRAMLFSPFQRGQCMAVIVGGHTMTARFQYELYSQSQSALLTYTEKPQARVHVVGPGGHCAMILQAKQDLWQSLKD